MKYVKPALCLIICLLMAFVFTTVVNAEDGDSDNASADVSLTVTVVQPAESSGDGGEPTYTIDTDIFGSGSTNPISYTGEVLRTIGGTSSDGNLDITIPKGTIAREEDGTRLKSLSIDAYENPPAPPADAHIIGLAYDFEPRGATFDPPMTITWEYNPDTLGNVTEESLVLAYYYEPTGEWVELESVVDPVNHTITARVPHFTVFAVIGKVPTPPPPTPATFVVSDLVVTPGEVYVGESVTIKALVTNTGEESGNCNVTLKINGVVEATKEVTINAGLSKEVTFSVSKTRADTYSVDVNSLAGSFKVMEKPTPPPPTPTEFAVSDLVVTPPEIYVGESVSIRVLVVNTGGQSGSCNVTLKLNSVVEATKEVTVEAGSSQEVAFSLSKDIVDTYNVDVNGLTGSFTVKEKPEEVVPSETNWTLISGIAGGLIVVGLIVFFVIRRKSKIR